MEGVVTEVYAVVLQHVKMTNLIVAMGSASAWMQFATTSTIASMSTISTKLTAHIRHVSFV